ncbi:hypothetical protein OV079_42000 [Nannocystis pusilla]|uniref:Uncharacterized protein n=1 Tax=Nannocystis pusilla TaxID=889268 RepID=A0A9X3J1T9_9BACT|nr:hypothetical protein [Nannocystis pusilla]MCY1012011.1 hypothetical protein [Nannocystis pusilla]
MLVPLRQAFVLDRGNLREPTSGRPSSATCGDDPGRSTAAEAGTSSSDASSEISPALAGTTLEAGEYDDCRDDPGDLADPNVCELDCHRDEHHRRGRPCLRPRPPERRDLSQRQGMRRCLLPLARPVIAVPRLLLPLALVLACAHLVPPAAPQENGIPVVDSREKPLPEPVQVASARAHGGCDTGAQCVEHLDPAHSVADGQQVCEADGARWLASACPHRGAHSACITEHFLVFEYGKPRAEEFGNPLHRDLVAAREACLTQSGEFYELTP